MRLEGIAAANAWRLMKRCNMKSSRSCRKSYFDDSRNMEIKTAVTALAALAQETRLSIYRLLVEAGPEGMAAGRISETLKVPGATLSFHLKELSRAFLVSARQEKQFIYYAVDFERMAELMTFLTQNCCQGMPQACLTVVETALGRCCPPQTKPKRKRR
jgi:ArsR family transcriptional regulator, arsenate/arsenite/antimonite-responsive transcriptional repressor